MKNFPLIIEAVAMSSFVILVVSFFAYELYAHIRNNTTERKQVSLETRMKELQIKEVDLRCKYAERILSDPNLSHSKKEVRFSVSGSFP